MRSKAKQLALIVLVCAFVMAWRTRADRDVVRAAEHKPVVVTHIFKGSDGLAHAEDIELKLNDRGVASMIKATGAEFSSRPPSEPNRERRFGPGPGRQFVITLSGRSEVEVSGGIHVSSGPGHINLIDDMGSQGHITTNFGPDDRIVLTVPLAPDAVIEGTKNLRTTSY